MACNLLQLFEAIFSKNFYGNKYISFQDLHMAYAIDTAVDSAFLAKN